MEKIVSYIEENAQSIEMDEKFERTLKAKYDRSDLTEAVATVDWAKVMNTYPQQILGKVIEHGSAFAFNGVLAVMLVNSALREVANRQPLNEEEQ